MTELNSNSSESQSLSMSIDQAANLEKDYMLRRHFSVWSEFPEMIDAENNYTKKRTFKIIYIFYNISTAVLLAFLCGMVVAEPATAHYAALPRRRTPR